MCVANYHDSASWLVLQINGAKTHVKQKPDNCLLKYIVSVVYNTTSIAVMLFRADEINNRVLDHTLIAAIDEAIYVGVVIVIVSLSDIWWMERWTETKKMSSLNESKWQCHMGQWGANGNPLGGSPVQLSNPRTAQQTFGSKNPSRSKNNPRTQSHTTLF